jgi:hypothetical protein
VSETSRLPEDQAHALDALLDCLIPPSADGRLPGAGALGVRTHFEAAIAERPELGPAIGAAVQALDALAQQRHAQPFATLDPARRIPVFAEFAEAQAGLLGALIFHTYLGYYRDPRVVAAHGMETRAPFPQGYEVPPNDLSLLDPVRDRPKLYREP